MLSSLKIRKFTMALSALLLLSGCISTSIEKTRFYVLNPLDTSVAAISNSEHRASELALEVDLLRIPRYLEKPQIVTRSGKNRLEFAEYHQWGGNLRKNMMRVIAKNLSLLLKTPNISIAPNRSSSSPDFRIELEILQFERDFDGRVKLSVQWRLSDKDRMLLATQITELTSPNVPAAPDFEQTVSTMSSLLGEFSQIIGKSILGHRL